MSRYSLSSEHYAHGWSAGEEYDLKTVNDLGVRYARAPEGVEKEDLLAQLLRHFHPYL